MTNHFRLDFNLIEGLTIVHTNNASNHFWHYNHVTKMSADWFWLFTGWSLPFLFQATKKLMISNTLLSAIDAYNTTTGKKTQEEQGTKILDSDTKKVFYNINAHLSQAINPDNYQHWHSSEIPIYTQIQVPLPTSA